MPASGFDGKHASQKILEKDKPVFGICRGLQLLNVFFGGTLYQDIPSQLESKVLVTHKQIPPYDQPSHWVSIESGTPLADLFQVERISVNSYHHQGIRKLAPKLCCAAKAPDGLIEAVFLPEKRFCLAVQWHPEFSWKNDSSSVKLFSAFVESML